MISHLVLLCKYLFGLLHACIFYLFFSFFSPISHTVPIKKTVTVSVEWLLFGGYWLCLSYLINTGNTMCTGMRENVQEMMPGVAVSFLRHQNWCRTDAECLHHLDLNIAKNSMQERPWGTHWLQRDATKRKHFMELSWGLGPGAGQKWVKALCTFPSGDEYARVNIPHSYISSFLLIFFFLWHTNSISSAWFPFINWNPW